MLFEIEQKVSYLSELSVHSESLLLEGRAETKEEAEQLTLKLHSLKDSLLELQQMLQDKQVDIQVRSEVICVLLSLSVPCMQSCCPALLFSLRLSFVMCCAALCRTGHSINGTIVQMLKLVSCPFINVHCFLL